MRRKNTKFIDPRYFMAEKMETIKEDGSPEANLDKINEAGELGSLEARTGQGSALPLSGAPAKCEEAFATVEAPFPKLGDPGIETDEDFMNAARSWGETWDFVRDNCGQSAEYLSDPRVGDRKVK